MENYFLQAKQNNMKLIQLTQPNGTSFYLNPSYIISINALANGGGSEILVSGSPVNVFVTQTAQDIISLINQ